MDEFWVLLVVIAGWFFLQGWLLPRMGVRT